MLYILPYIISCNIVWRFTRKVEGSILINMLATFLVYSVAINLANQRNERDFFVSLKSLQTVIKEQATMFENLSEGAIIHSKKT